MTPLSDARVNPLQAQRQTDRLPLACVVRGGYQGGLARLGLPASRLGAFVLLLGFAREPGSPGHQTCSKDPRDKLLARAEGLTGSVAWFPVFQRYKGSAVVEHRCGNRRRIDVRVTVSSCSGGVGQGIVREISVSGARVESRLPVWSQSVVTLQFLTHPHPGRCARHRVEAEVVRQTEGGFALEWMELAPEVVRTLLQDLQDVVPMFPWNPAADGTDRSRQLRR